jgi:hypothetical protein
VRQDRPHHGLDLSILSGAILIPKPILREYRARLALRIAANIAKLPDLLPQWGRGAPTSIAAGGATGWRDLSPAHRGEHRQPASAPAASPKVRCLARRILSTAS